MRASQFTNVNRMAYGASLLAERFDGKPVTANDNPFCCGYYHDNGCANLAQPARGYFCFSHYDTQNPRRRAYLEANAEARKQQEQQRYLDNREDELAYRRNSPEYRKYFRETQLRWKIRTGQIPRCARCNTLVFGTGGMRLCDECKLTHGYCGICKQVKPHAEMSAAAGSYFRCLECERIRRSPNRTITCESCGHDFPRNKGRPKKLCERCEAIVGWCRKCKLVKLLEDMEGRKNYGICHGCRNKRGAL